jgi:hypothetical protein
LAGVKAGLSDKGVARGITHNSVYLDSGGALATEKSAGEARSGELLTAFFDALFRVA